MKTEKIKNIEITNQDNAETAEPIISPGQLVFKRFRRNKLAIVGIIILVLMFLFCFIGPVFSPYTETGIFYVNENGEEFESSSSIDFSAQKVMINSKAPPSDKHFFGTDKEGRDVLIRLMHGGRVSLVIGFVCVFIEILIGVVMGGISGYYGGWTDGLIMRLVDIFYCIPSFPLILIVSSILTGLVVPPRQHIYYIILMIALLGWAGVARLVRGQILSLREQEYMVAAEAAGLKTRRKIFKHLMPNVMPQLIVSATLGIGGVILMESALAFLGLGVKFPFASWGNMVGAVTDTLIMRNNLNIWVPPGICIFLTVMAFNFVGDGLRDAYDPKMKR